MPIHTERLSLRCFTSDDFAALRELESDPRVLRFRARQHISPDMTRDFLERAQCAPSETPRALYAYAIVRRDDDVWLGQCGLTVLIPSLTEAFVWAALLPRYWGRGYMSEALRALLYAGLTDFKLDRILGESHPENVASLRVMAKAGMRLEGPAQFTDAQGAVLIRIRYVITRADLPPFAPTPYRIEAPV